MKSTSANGSLIQTSLHWRRSSLRVFVRVRLFPLRSNPRKESSGRSRCLCREPPRALTLRSRLPMRWSTPPTKFDVDALEQIFGSGGKDIVFTR